MFDTLIRDVRFALRSLARRPLFTGIVVVTLALGIGANTAIFSAVHAVLLRPLPAPALDRLVMVYDDLPGLNLPKSPMGPGEVADLFARTDLFEVSAAYSEQGVLLAGLGEPQRVDVTQTMGQFFDLLGARPYLGRLYGAEDSEPGRAEVVVLSYAFWRSWAGGDRGILGRKVDLNGGWYEVIGVLPPEARFPRKAQIWIPVPVTPELLAANNRLRLYMSFVGRLRPEVTREQLAGQLRTEAERWHERFPGNYSPQHRHTLVSEPFVDALAGQLRPVLLVLLGAVGLVLLIACANVASLQMVRATGRERELAVRTALGASRWPLARQLLVESLVLAVAGGLAGLLVGAWIVEILSGWDAVQAQFSALEDVRLSPAVLTFTAGVTGLSALLFGLIPALRAARVDPQEVLKEASRGTSGGARQKRLLEGSVVVQLALTLVLLLASALTIRSLSRLLDTDPGFKAERVMTMSLSLPRVRYPGPAARTAFFDALLERLEVSPGVEAVGLVAGLPFGSGGDSSPFDLPGRPQEPGEPERHANIRIVAGDYFRTLGIPLLRGRSFDRTDVLRSPDDPNPLISVVIDETLAKKYFGDEDPIGRQIVHAGPPAVIVGIVGGVRDEELGREAYPTVYYTQRQIPAGMMAIAVRGSLEPAATVALVRSAVAQLDREIPLYKVAPLTELVDRSLGTRRLAMAVLTGFAALSLALAVLGVYGVISYSVTQRTHEIGIRMALGARPEDVERMVLAAGLALTLAGTVAGTLVFLGLGKALGALLYGVGPRDPLVIGLGAALLAGVALIATYLPARRAAELSPLEALRVE
ncbi:MAG TPA: ABC transporter permease [Thermoanaerobaculia bacterium]|nr:ABC transporter permease [Thermoanaerobaculia bacterium]